MLRHSPLESVFRLERPLHVLQGEPDIPYLTNPMQLPGLASAPNSSVTAFAASSFLNLINVCTIRHGMRNALNFRRV